MTDGRPPLDQIAERQVLEVVDLIRGVRGLRAMAAYLYGSAVSGGLRPDSDLDILIVLERPLTDARRDGLLQGLLERSRSAAHRERRSLEVTAVVLDDIVPWRYPPRLELQYGDWWRAEFIAGEMTPWTSPNPDLAVVLTSVRDDGVALFGPPPGELLPHVPVADLRRASRDVIPELLPGLRDDDTRNALLTLARIWFTLETGRIASKDTAATWALRRLPAGAGDALRLARDAYLGDAVDTWDAAAIALAQTAWEAIEQRLGDA